MKEPVCIPLPPPFLRFFLPQMLIWHDFRRVPDPGAPDAYVSWPKLLDEMWDFGFQQAFPMIYQPVQMLPFKRLRSVSIREGGKDGALPPGHGLSVHAWLTNDEPEKTFVLKRPAGKPVVPALENPHQLWLINGHDIRRSPRGVSPGKHALLLTAFGEPDETRLETLKAEALKPRDG